MKENEEQQAIPQQEVAAQDSDIQQAQCAEQAPAPSMAQDDDDDLDLQHWRDLVATFKLDGTWFRKQFYYVVLLAALMVGYVTWNYHVQQNILEEEQLSEEVKDSKYRCLTRESELTRRTTQSAVENALCARGDSTLASSEEPPYLLTNE